MNAVKLKMVRNIIVFEKEPRRFGEHILGKKAIVGSSTKNNRWILVLWCKLQYRYNRLKFSSSVSPTGGYQTIKGRKQQFCIEEEQKGKLTLNSDRKYLMTTCYQ